MLLDEEGNLVFRGGSGDTAQDFLSLMVSGKEKEEGWAARYLLPF